MNYVQLLNLKEGEQLTNAKKLIDYITKLATDNAYETFMQFVSTDKDVREKSKALSEKLEKEMNTLSLSKDVYDLIEGLEYDDNDMSTDAQIYRNTILSLRRSGCHLNPEDNKRCKEIADCMTKLSSDFESNIAESTVRVELDGDEVLALENFCKTHNVTIPSNNTLELKGYGLYFKILDFCDVESVREKAYIAFNTVAKGNLEILDELQKLRQENAKLLGYQNHAEYKLEVNAIGTPTDAIGFLEKFHTILGAQLQTHQKIVTDALGISVETFMKSHNKGYYFEKYKKNNHNMDSTYYKSFFEVDNITKAMLRRYENFFEVTFTPTKPTNSWHEDVQLYTVNDLEGRRLGQVYLDLYARDGKMSHPSHFGIVRRHQYLDGSSQDTTSVLLTSFDKASPTLLTHDEVETMFHEFGHAMHELLNAETNASLGGTHVTHDLVEVPSMFLEYLCWDSKFLKEISQHYETGEQLSDEKVHNLIAAKHVCPSFNMLLQLSYGLFDLEFHTNAATVADFNQRITAVSHIIRPGNTWGVARFIHLVGYDAQYYTYMYSQSYAAVLKEFIGDFNDSKSESCKKKYLEFLRHSTKENLVKLIGKNDPSALIREISSN